MKLHMKFLMLFLTLSVLSCDGATVTIQKKGTQYVAKANIPTERPDKIQTPCGENQALVDGNYCPDAIIKCKTPSSGQGVTICMEYAPTSCASSERKHLRFCMDKYEYPNEPGALPVSWKSWYEAKSMCESKGKRLCKDYEWTFACEGPEIKPYPYGDGLHRDHQACNTARKWKDYTKTPKDELYQGEPSGSRQSCVSPFGVYDMPGNVDEWAVSSSGKPYPSVLKGGHASFVRNACRPATDGHGPTFSLYETGFRCCSEAK